jgi:hypothetical protein
VGGTQNVSFLGRRYFKLPILSCPRIPPATQAIGLLVIALAAGVGTIRFLNIAPLRRRNAVISLHTKLSWFATILGE